jgi:hypothetical protein
MTVVEYAICNTGGTWEIFWKAADSILPFVAMNGHI